MDRTEVIKIMAVLRGAYPQFYRTIDRKEAEDTVNLWSEMFSDEPYPVVAAAVKALIAADSKGFPPVIGQVRAKIRQITTPDEMTESEAWGLINKALGNSAYGSAEEFNKLPAILQRLVGSPNQLREWSQMDTETVQSVVASNFQRSYRARAAQQREYDALPGDVKAFVGQLASGMKMEKELPMGASGQLGQAELEAIQRILAQPLEDDDGGQDGL